MLSSLKLTSKTPIGKQEGKKIKNILQSLINSNDSIQFRAPVDWKGLNLNDYLYFIKHPMDLGTVTNKFNNNHYQFVEEVLDDIQLIWDNCKTYNPPDYWIYGVAEKLERSFKKMIKNYLPYISVVVPGRNGPLTKQDRKISQTSNQKYPQQSNNPNPNINNQNPNNQSPPLEQNQPSFQITYTQKQKLSDRLKTLPPIDLGTIVQYIMEKYPNVFKETGQENAELLIDNFDFRGFKDVQGRVQEILGECVDKVTKRVARE